MSRTMISNWLKMVLGALVGAGLMPQEVMDALLQNVELVIGGGLAVWGIVDAWIRNLTTGPLASWWGKK